MSEAAMDIVKKNADENIVAYILQDDLCNRLTPRVVDIAYNAFLLAKRPNDEDGGPSDWFNDTRPHVMEMIEAVAKKIPASAMVPDKRDVLIRKLVLALEFYGNPDNYIDTPSWDGDPQTYTEKAIPVIQSGGKPCDCGDTARAALTEANEAGYGTK